MTSLDSIMTNDAEQLLVQIDRLSTHLETIATDDDCAYEKMRLRAYETLLEEQRQRLDLLRAADLE